MPSISSIQDRLDRIDRTRKLKGTNTWIGSTEISWVVEKLTSPPINCRIVNLPKGEKISTKYEELKNHIENTGSPVMYAGGQYAYTIVGMHYSWKLGECEFLILDPHYTGPDDYGKIVEKKGVFWKKAE
jgi:hypothetical protein